MTYDDQTSVSLKVGEWNTLISILRKQPYEVVADMIGQITQQVQVAIQSSSVPVPVHTNGSGPSVSVGQ